MIRVFFEPRDLWIGVCWNCYPTGGVQGAPVVWWLDIYVCLVPCLPIKLSFKTRKKSLGPLL